jgi:hypothetical protein
MQAFQFTLVNNSKFYFCSLSCARTQNVSACDGEFVQEKDFPETEKCSNCNIPLNDGMRAVAHISVDLGEKTIGDLRRIYRRGA